MAVGTGVKCPPVPGAGPTRSVGVRAGGPRTAAASWRFLLTLRGGEFAGLAFTSLWLRWCHEAVTWGLLSQVSLPRAQRVPSTHTADGRHPGPRGRAAPGRPGAQPAVAGLGQAAKGAASASFVRRGSGDAWPASPLASPPRTPVRAPRLGVAKGKGVEWRGAPRRVLEGRFLDGRACPRAAGGGEDKCVSGFPAFHPAGTGLWRQLLNLNIKRRSC